MIGPGPPGGSCFSTAAEASTDKATDMRRFLWSRLSALSLTCTLGRRAPFWFGARGVKVSPEAGSRTRVPRSSKSLHVSAPLFPGTLHRGSSHWEGALSPTPFGPFLPLCPPAPSFRISFLPTSLRKLLPASRRHRVLEGCEVRLPRFRETRLGGGRRA